MQCPELAVWCARKKSSIELYFKRCIRMGKEGQRQSGVLQPTGLLSALPCETVWWVWEGNLKPTKTSGLLESHWHLSCRAPQSPAQPWRCLSQLYVILNIYFIYIYIAPCYSGNYFCETILINQKTISAPVLKSVLPNICSRRVKFQFPFPGFRVTSALVLFFRLCSFLVNPKDFPMEKSSSCQISFKAGNRGVAFPLTCLLCEPWSLRSNIWSALPDLNTSQYSIMLGPRYLAQMFAFWYPLSTQLPRKICFFLIL